MPTVINSGSLTTTGAEVTFATVNANKVLVLNLDLANMAAGDVIRFRAYKRVRTGDSDRLCMDETFSGVQAQPGQYSLPIPSPFNAFFTCIQIAGTFRAIPYSVDDIS